MAPLGRLGDFATELRRRHVMRVAIVYGAVAWLLAQVSATVFPALGMPAWTVTLVVMLLILGFPVALILAWAFDLTPAGVRRTPPAAAMAAAEGAVSAAPASLSSAPVIVALPFEDRSSTADQRYLGEGITDELINGLAQIPGVRVVSRTTAFALREGGQDAREIGARLGVTHIVEGSVRVAGERLRIAVQLVNARDGLAMWSAAFDRLTHDVLAVQEEVARALIGALREALQPPGDVAIATSSPALQQSVFAGSAIESDRPVLQHSTRHFEAYTLYLRGRQQWGLRTAESLHRAIGYFERALERDPAFAHAHAGLADCWAILMDHGLVPPARGMPTARAAAADALRLGSQFAESHAAAALVAQLDWDWAAAESGFRAALARNPSYAPARHRLALLLAWLGRIDEARLEMQHALEADPLSTVIATSRGWIEYYARDFAAAATIEQAVLAEQPDATPARVPLGVSLLQLGQAAEAAVQLQHALEEAGENPVTTSLLVNALSGAGRTDEARALLSRLESRAADAPYALALGCLAVGGREEALASLERALDARSAQLARLRMEPLFDTLRDDARFQRLLDAVGLATARAAPHPPALTRPAVRSP